MSAGIELSTDISKFRVTFIADRELLSLSNKVIFSKFIELIKLELSVRLEEYLNNATVQNVIRLSCT